jgi:ribosomal silencing factor RsfS
VTKISNINNLKQLKWKNLFWLIVSEVSIHYFVPEVREYFDGGSIWQKRLLIW